MDIPGERVEVYSEPSGDAYLRAEQFARGSRPQAQTLKELSVSFDELLG